MIQRGTVVFLSRPEVTPDLSPARGLLLGSCPGGQACWGLSRVAATPTCPAKPPRGAGRPRGLPVTPGRGRPMWTLQGRPGQPEAGEGWEQVLSGRNGCPGCTWGCYRESYRALQGPVFPHPVPQPPGWGKRLVIRNCMMVAIVTREKGL